MRFVLAALAVATVSFVPAVGSACGGRNDNVVIEQAPVRESAADLREQARQLDARAASLVQEARMAEQRAAKNTTHAQILRAEADDAVGEEREILLARAERLEAAAERDRHTARRRHDGARQLQASAASLRRRADAIDGGGGWRNRRRNAPVA